MKRLFLIILLIVACAPEVPTGWINTLPKEAKSEILEVRKAAPGWTGSGNYLSENLSGTWCIKQYVAIKKGKVTQHLIYFRGDKEYRVDLTDLAMPVFYKEKEGGV